MKKNGKQRLIFHFFVADNVKSSEVAELHFACLSKYAHIFNEALFILTANNIENNDNIDYVKTRLIDCGFCDNVKFVVEENESLRESGTFYKYVVKQMNKLDGLTFFGHSKGVGNELSGEFNMDEIHAWIAAAYFLNLDYMDEVRKCLLESPFHMTFGSLKCSWEDIENRYRWIYSGTFFWINAQRLYAYLERHGIEIPTPHNRYYSECFLGDVIDINYYSCSHDMWYLIGDGCQGWYHKATAYIDSYLRSDEDKARYKEYIKEVLKKDA